MAKLISQVNYSQLSACQGDMEPFIDHPSTHGCLTSLRNKSSLGKLQCQYVTELLINVYSYRLMEKSVSSCCVRGRWILSNPVTFVEGFPEDSAIAILFMLTICNLPTGTCLLMFSCSSQSTLLSHFLNNSRTINNQIL